MATKKKAAAKKKYPKLHRAPRQVWITFNPENGRANSVHMSRRAALEEEKRTGLIEAGPMILAERVGNE